MVLGDGLLKTDSVGRIRIPVERRVALLAEFDRSGMSGVQFARHVGVKYSTFAFWIQDWRRRAGLGASLEASERPLMEAADRESGLEVRLPGGARMIVRHPGEVPLAADLLRALAATTGRSGC